MTKKVLWFLLLSLALVLCVSWVAWAQEPDPCDPDQEPPTITCPNDVRVNTDQGVCQASVNPGTPTASDNCGEPEVSGSRSDGKELGDPYPVGTTTITWTATDGAGNTASCTQRVTVVDAERPTITCPNDVRANTDQGVCQASVNPGTPTASDNCGEPEVSGSRSDGKELGDPYPVGTTTITWTATDGAGNTASCTQRVTVVDSERPTIICPEAITTRTAPGKCSAPVEFAATATDNCDEEVTIEYYMGNQIISERIYSGHEFPVGTSGVFAIAEDSAGNVSYCVFEVTVVDADPPTITCPQGINAYGCGATVYFEARASDNCGTAEIDYFIGEQEISSPHRFPVGTTVVAAVATDGVGNSASCSFIVTVTNTPPIARDDNVSTFENRSVSINVLANDEDPDEDTLNVVSVGEPAHGTATIEGGRITYTPEAHYVGNDSFTYTISDGCETAEATVYITIIIQGTERIYGWVFFDDGDGVREPGETTGLGGVILELWDEGTMVATTDTSAPDGAYEFVDVPAGFYHVEVQVPLDYVPTSPTRVGVEVVHGHWAQANFGVKRYETPTPTPTNTPTPTGTSTPTPTSTPTSPKTDTWIFLPLIRK